MNLKKFYSGKNIDREQNNLCCNFGVNFWILITFRCSLKLFPWELTGTKDSILRGFKYSITLTGKFAQHF